MKHESHQPHQQSSIHPLKNPPQEKRQRRRQQEQPHAWNQRKSAAVIKNMSVIDSGSSTLSPPPPPPGPPPIQSPQPLPQREASQQQPRQQQSRQQQQKHIDNSSSSNNVTINASVVTDTTRPCFQIPALPSSGIVAFGWIDQHRRSKLCMVWKEVLATLYVRGNEETELLIQRGVVIDDSAAATGTVSEKLVELHRIPMRWLVDAAYVDSHGDHRFVLKVTNIAEEFVFRTRDEQSAMGWISKLLKMKLVKTSSNHEFMKMQMHQLNIHHENDNYRVSRDNRDAQSQLSMNRPQPHSWPQQQKQMNALESSTSLHMPSNNVNSNDSSGSNCDDEPVMSAAWQQLSNPYDAASYLPNQEQHSYNDTRPHQSRQLMHQHRQQYKQNHQRQQPPPPPSSPPLLPTTLTSSKYSYEWDPQNLQRFLSTRRAMIRAIFSTPNTVASILSPNDVGENNKQNIRNSHIHDSHDNTIDGNGIEIGIGDSHSKVNKSNVKNSSTNFKSGGSNTMGGGNNKNDMPFFITSPTRPPDSKQYAEDAGGVEARSSFNEIHAHDAGVDAGADGWTTTNMRQPQHKKLPLRRSQTEPTNVASVTKDAHTFIPPMKGHLEGSSLSSSIEITPLPKDYFGYAIRSLLIDTPLPLIGSCPPPTPPSDSATIPIPHHSVGNMNAALNYISNTSAEIDYNRSSKISSSSEKKYANNNHGTNEEDDNHDDFTKTTTTQPLLPQKLDSIGAGETIYLIPRYYLLRWTQWARCTILNASVESWFAAWKNFDVHREEVEGGEGQQEERVYYSLPPEAVKAIAALSILSEQYQLFINTENDFISWMNDLESYWVTWNRRVRKYHRHLAQSSQEEEVPQAFPHLTFPLFHSPGPVDSRILSTRHNPLLMHHHVALSMRGILSSYNYGLASGEDVDDGNNDTNSNDSIVVLSPAEDASESKLISFIDTELWVPDDEYALATHSTRRLAVVPVPTSFYELLRSVHGVICDDGDLSFAPPLPYVIDVGGRLEGMAQQTRIYGAKVNCGVSFSSSSSLLFHDQWEGGLDDPNHSTKHRINHLNRDMFGRYHRQYFTNDHQSKIDQSFRPIEFRRRLLPVPSANEVEEDEGGNNSESYANVAAKGVVPNPYLTLMQEAIKSKKSYDAKEMEDRNGDSSVSSRGTKSNDAKKGVAGYVVEVFPVKFKYIIVDNDTVGDYSGCLGGRHNPKQIYGLALGSRSSSAFTVLRDIQRAAAPNRAHACVRLWKKSPCPSATVKGNGYDLLDITKLHAPPSVRSSCRGGGSDKGEDGGSSKGSSPRLIQQSHTQQHQQEPSLTVGEWLGLEPLSIQSVNRQKRQCISGEEEVAVDLLIEVRNSPASKWELELLELENRLQVGDYVDAQDSAGKWYEAIVREIKPETIKVHYFGWGSKWDAELPRKNGSGSKLSPPRPLWSRSSTWRDQIKVGDDVEIRESTSLVQRPKWHRATVLAVGEENDVPRALEGGAELELLGLNAAGKKVPLTLLNRKVQVLVEVPQEMHNLPSSTPFKPRLEGIPVAQPPYRRWVNLYGEEICKANTHKTADKKRSDLPVTLNYTLESKRDVVEVLKPYNNIHGSGFVRESLRGIPPSSGTVGLHNLGNSCYMNSILQCISHIEPITQFFLKGEYIKEINKMNPLGSGGRLATAYASFLADVYSGEYSILAPRLLKQTLCSFAPQFNNNYQHDSQEFCQYLMDGLHEDLNRVRSKPYVEEMEALGVKDSKAAMESWKKHLLRHDSIFVDYLQGMHRSHLTCPRCGKESIKFDVYSSISLPLVPAKEKSSIRLSDCLDQFAAGEQLDEHNAWYCSSCKRHVCALKLITLWNTPDVLILHLKRFTFEKCPIDGRILRRKIEDKVDFPIDRLDLSSYILGPKDLNAPPVYKLFGVSEHTGSTSNSGHYTATVRNSEDGNWYRFNDSHVGTTCEPAVTGGAYLLFYRRVKGSLRWAGMEKQMIDHDSGIYLNSAQAEEDSDGFLEVTGKKRRK